MSKRKNRRDWAPERFWQCEDCGHVHEEMADPPDECAYCGYRYFTNMADDLAGKTEVRA